MSNRSPTIATGVLSRAGSKEHVLSSCAVAGTERDVRRRMADLGEWLQPWLSRITGKAIPGQRLRSPGRLARLAQAAAWTAVGVTGGLLIYPHWDLWCFYPLFWAITVHGARVLQVQMMHQAAHGTLVGNRQNPRPRLNTFFGHLISISLLVQEFGSYRRSHLEDHHHRRRLSTTMDPTVRLLRSAGLEPGLPTRTLWQRLLLALISPLFHGRRIAERLLSHFRGTFWSYRAVVLIYLMMWTSLGVMTGLWGGIVLAVLIPLFPLFEISATLRLCVEHEWPSDGEVGSREEYAELTHAVFCGSMPPAPGASICAWAGWAIRMFGSALVRWTVLVGDTPCHDEHHAQPQSYDWADYLTRRSDAVSRAADEGQNNYTEIWGLFNALQHQFLQLSRSTPWPQGQQLCSGHMTN